MITSEDKQQVAQKSLRINVKGIRTQTPPAQLILNELWDWLRQWERELDYLNKEYRILMRLARKRVRTDFRRTNALGHPFYNFSHLMEREMKRFKEELKQFRTALMAPSDQNPMATAQLQGQSHEMHKKLRGFEDEAKSLKLKFLHELERHTPVEIF